MPIIDNIIHGVLYSKSDGNKPVKNQLRQQFLEEFLPEFDCAAYLTVAGRLHIVHKTAEKYVHAFCEGGEVCHVTYSKYSKK